MSRHVLGAVRAARFHRPVRERSWTWRGALGVVVRGPRGVEVGDVLSALEHTQDRDDGALLRCVTPSDEADWDGLATQGQAVLAAAEAGASGLPLTFVDVELTLDGIAILHALAWSECDATPLLEELSTRLGLSMRLLDLSRSPIAREEIGCGKPGCGAEGGGCSSCGTEGERMFKRILFEGGGQIAGRTDYLLFRPASSNGRSGPGSHAVKLTSGHRILARRS